MTQMRLNRNSPLKNIERLGNFVNPDTNDSTVVFIGHKPGNNHKQLFWNKSGYRVVITQREFKAWRSGTNDKS